MTKYLKDLYINYLYAKFDKTNSLYYLCVQQLYTACSLRDSLEFVTYDTEIWDKHLFNQIESLRERKNDLSARLNELDRKLTALGE